MRKTQRRIRRRRGTKKYVRGGAPPRRTKSPPRSLFKDANHDSRSNIENERVANRQKMPSTLRNYEQQKYYNEINKIKDAAFDKIEGINRRINDYIIHSITTEESIIFENVKIIKELKNRLYNTNEQIKQLNDGMTKKQINDVLAELEKINIDVEELIKGVSLSEALGRTPTFPR